MGFCLGQWEQTRINLNYEENVDIKFDTTMTGMGSSVCLCLISCGVTVTLLMREFQHSNEENINFTHKSTKNAKHYGLHL